MTSDLVKKKFTMHNCVTMHIHIKGSGLIPKNLTRGRKFVPFKEYISPPHIFKRKTIIMGPNFKEVDDFHITSGFDLSITIIYLSCGT